MKTVRAYTLAAYPNPGKAEEYRYAMYWYRQWFLYFVSRAMFKPKTYISTAGLGSLPHQAQRRAFGQAKGLLALRKKGNKVSPPADFPLMADGMVQRRKGGTFDYWIKVPTCPWIPAKGHRALNAMLDQGGKLVDTCEVIEGKDRLEVRVFVEIEVPEAVDTGSYLGVDVGVNNIVARSDGYLSKSARPIMARAREKGAERSRQGHERRSNRTSLKQQIDIEARKAVTLAAERGKTLVVESSKILANLKTRGSIGGWARIHFGLRVRQIAEVVGVAVREVWPGYSSQECLHCGHSSRKNRQGKCFRCERCGYRTDADISAARVLTCRATV